jgi:demethylmenaquinone methyltransferase/2-methoxy-6-polyprenyl-1,4-benzoquinol methylase
MTDRPRSHTRVEEVASQAPHPVLSRYYARESDRQPFVAALFDGAARHYDLACGLMSLGLGRPYRRWALARAGLARGMRLLDVAAGTGLVARSAVDILGDPRAVVALDPSRAMLRRAQRAMAAPPVQGTAEQLPFPDGAFDFVSMGYALRHVADLGVAFRECLRVLKPGGRLLVLEISRPPSPLGRRLLRLHLQRVLPLVLRVGTRSPHARLLTTYYWDTIAQCVAPGVIVEALRGAGFADARVEVRLGCFAEYLGSRPAP